MRLSSRHERWMYTAGGALLLSGLGWLIGHFWLAGGPLAAAFAFDAVPHPSEIWWLRLHGAAAMGFLVAFGALLPGHVVQGWRRRQNRRSGILMLTVVVALALTGYGLYYLGDESTRPWISAAHWAIGLVAATGLVVHVILGKHWTIRTQAGRGRGRRRAHGSEPAQPEARQRAIPHFSNSSASVDSWTITKGKL